MNKCELYSNNTTTLVAWFDCNNLQNRAITIWNDQRPHPLRVCLCVCVCVFNITGNNPWNLRYWSQIDLRMKIIILWHIYHVYFYYHHHHYSRNLIAEKFFNIFFLFHSIEFFYFLFFLLNDLIVKNGKNDDHVDKLYPQQQQKRQLRQQLQMTSTPTLFLGFLVKKNAKIFSFFSTR